MSSADQLICVSPAVIRAGRSQGKANWERYRDGPKRSDNSRDVRRPDERMRPGYWPCARCFSRELRGTVYEVKGIKTAVAITSGVASLIDSLESRYGQINSTEVKAVREWGSL